MKDMLVLSDTDRICLYSIKVELRVAIDVSHDEIKGVEDIEPGLPSCVEVKMAAERLANCLNACELIDRILAHDLVWVYKR